MLISSMFRNDHRLQSCLTTDSSHLVPGTVGPHVARVQAALFVVDGLRVSREDERNQQYGTSTSAAVLDFKTRRGIINRAYQSQPDNIVGKMTISALDQELVAKEGLRPNVDGPFCGDDPRLPRGTTGSSVTLASFTRAPGSTGVVAAFGIGGASTPAAVAKQRAPGALAMVGRAQAKLNTLINDRAHPSVPPSPVVIDVAEALWRNFGVPSFPKNNPLLADAANGAVTNLEQYLAVIGAVLQGMALNLGQAGLLFKDPPSPSPKYDSAGAYTLSLSRSSGDPPFPDGIYFNPVYLNNGGTPTGALKQSEIAIHECAHLVQNDNISDNSPKTLSWAYGYSNFVLHCALGRETIGDAE